MNLTALPSLLGGALIGASASLLLWSHGRVAGISGLLTTVLTPRSSDAGARSTAVPFVVGLALAGLVLGLVWPSAAASSWVPSLGLALVSGLVVGLGTGIGSGCTSGHG